MRSRFQRAIAGFRREDGSGVVEIAFASLVLIATMLGVCEVSLAWYYGHFCSDAARQATRYAMVRGAKSCTNTPNLSKCDVTADQIKAYVKQLGYPAIVSGSVGVTTTWYQASTTEPTSGQTATWTACPGACNAPGNMVQVVVTYPMSLPIPAAAKTLSLNLKSTSQMLIAQ